jgi:ubiquitin carboxyl-terminal hydrolase 22/27/51
MAKTSCRGKLSDVCALADITGLRPLLNLSQTCFLSSILQALIHNPLLKAYFLSDKHNRHICTNGSRGLAVGRPNMGTDSGTGTPSDRERGCMCCEMDRAFDEFYSDDTTPFGPVTMLYSMWHASTELEGHGQQDAHAFFLAALEQIHQNAKGQLSSCNCIAREFKLIT